MDDLIRRQAAIKAIENLQDCYNGFSDTYDKACIIGALEEVPSAQRTGRWIPVSERLPEAGEYVGDVAKYYLVQNEFGDMLVARYAHSGYWEQIYQYKPCADEIVAWMPLPEPYKEEQE